MDDYQVEVKLDVIRNLNEHYGKKLLDLQECLKLLECKKREKAEIEVKLDVLHTDSFIGNTLKDAEKVIESGNDLIRRSKDIIQHIEKDLDDVDDVRKDIHKYFEKINGLQCLLQYFRVIQHIEHLSRELEKEMGKKDDERCATMFANLTEINRILADTRGKHLSCYLKETIYYWHNILKEKFARDFDDVLKAIKWPFVSTNFSLVVPLPNHVQKLQTISEYLLQIEIPSESSVPVATSGLLSNFPPLCLPLQLMVLPLRKRFIYHFYGTRQTNRVDKPEWYFTQILTWVRDHKDFVGKYIQPVIEKLGLHHIDAKLEFIRGLIEISVEKLNSDLPNLQFDDFTFSHSIDEALCFDKELRETYEYPSIQPGVLTVLTQGQVFMKWIAMEKKYATEKMDAMLPPNAVDAFEPLTSDVEDLKITTCADAFITLLQTIMERYEALPQPGHRLQFLELQLELLDDFRVRLLQLVNAEEGDIVESRIPSIANSIYYIENVLLDWGTMLHYLNLYYYQSQLKSEKQAVTPSFSDIDDDPLYEIETDTVFAETLSLYRHMRNDLLHTLAEIVMAEIKARSKAYRSERWSAIKVEKEFRSLSLTPTACPMFEVLSKRLHQLQKSLQSKLFTFVWHSLAQQMDTYLFEELVVDNRFSEGGALQFKFDVTRNLIPLFSQFSERPHNYFSQCQTWENALGFVGTHKYANITPDECYEKLRICSVRILPQLIESCNLLNVSKGSALLLRETIIALEGATGVEDTRSKALKEIGVNNFTPKIAVRILNQRADITINRILID